MSTELFLTVEAVSSHLDSLLALMVHSCEDYLACYWTCTQTLTSSEIEEEKKRKYIKQHQFLLFSRYVANREDNRVSLHVLVIRIVMH